MQTIDERARDAARDLRTSVAHLDAGRVAGVARPPRPRRHRPMVVAFAALVVLGVAGGLTTILRDDDAPGRETETHGPSTTGVQDRIERTMNDTTWSVELVAGAGGTDVCWTYRDDIGTDERDCVPFDQVADARVVGIGRGRLVLRAVDSDGPVVLATASSESRMAVVGDGDTRVAADLLPQPAGASHSWVEVVYPGATGRTLRDRIDARAVPRVVGLTVAEATREIEAVGLRAEVQGDPSRRVITQSPASPLALDVALRQVILITGTVESRNDLPATASGTIGSRVWHLRFREDASGARLLCLEVSGPGPTGDPQCTDVADRSTIPLLGENGARFVLVPVDEGEVDTMIDAVGVPLDVEFVGSGPARFAWALVPEGTHVLVVSRILADGDRAEPVQTVDTLEAVPVPAVHSGPWSDVDQARATLEQAGYIVRVSDGEPVREGAYISQDIVPGTLDLSIGVVTLSPLYAG